MEQPTALDEGTLIRLRRVFHRDHWSWAEKLLSGWKPNHTHRASARMHRAAIKCSGGNIEKLKEAMALGDTDFRDLLMAAEFGHDVDAHDQWMPAESPK